MSTSATKLTFVHWLVIIIASLGFLFDTYQLLMTPLVGPPAIAELLKLPPGHPAIKDWMGTTALVKRTVRGRFWPVGWMAHRQAGPQVRHGTGDFCLFAFAGRGRLLATASRRLSCSAA